jgi:hypothetical protein
LRASHLFIVDNESQSSKSTYQICRRTMMWPASLRQRRRLSIALVGRSRPALRQRFRKHAKPEAGGVFDFGRLTELARQLAKPPATASVEVNMASWLRGNADLVKTPKRGHYPFESNDR